ncbi:unnamed protein product [Penicillium pancosmium]
MPAYFYHLILEFFPGPQSSSPTTSLALESAYEALRPFQSIASSKSNLTSSANTTNELTLNQKSRHRYPDSSSDSGHPSASAKTATSTPSKSPSSSHTPSTSLSSSNNSTDIRFDSIAIECIDMVTPDCPPKRARARSTAQEEDNLVAAGIGTEILGGVRTKGRYIPLDQKVGESIWGIVHLYRDVRESSFLADDDDYPTYLKGSSAAVARRGPDSGDYDAIAAGSGPGASSKHGGRYGHGHGRSRSGARSTDLSGYPFPVIASSSAQGPEEDCTTLCILAVPAYLSGSDFLGFVGEKTLDEVCHFRMIRTSRANRYMVLMQFRSGRKAREWQKEWNGKVFNSMEPETCHVVFVKSVEIQVAEPGSLSGFSSDSGALPPSSSQVTPRHGVVSSTGQATLSSKPLAPPTPALIELPTCPVCLERMDETTGLLTIICQHVFHCTCLQKWKGSGCPVCRYTQDEFRKTSQVPCEDEDPAECSVCQSELNLWACLICGSVGCGRYDGAHAFDHWKQTSHAFAMDLTSQRVWDYDGDAYVHRIIQSKPGGKLLELPAADHSALDPPDWEDAVPREKLENMSVEYTHLLTSQLESQRAYFEEIVERAADKASQASAAAAAAEAASSKTTMALEDLQSKYDALSAETIPGLERDRTRLEKRADKFESLARRMEKDYREEKTMNQSLLERLDLLSGENTTLKAAKVDLEDQNRDLTFFISSSQQLQGQGEDIVQGTVSVPEPEVKKKKNKGKGRK